MSTIKDQLESIRKVRRKKLTREFKAWVRKQFGRALRKGDQLQHKTEGFICIVVDYGWDWQYPTVVSTIDGAIAYLGKTRLKQLILL